MGHRKWKEKLPVNYENYIKKEQDIKKTKVIIIKIITCFNC